MTNAELNMALEVAYSAWTNWRQTSLTERAALMRSAASVLRANTEELARTMTIEMGKPITEARAEIGKCAVGCEFFAESAAGFLREQALPSDTPNTTVVYDPLGPILAIMPWNFPFWQVFRHGAPGLMAGNGLVVKHAPNVPMCAEAIEAVFIDAGFPKGLVTCLFIEPPLDSVIGDPRIAAVTLTGSEAAGRAVASAAGAHIKKTVLELGGSDPFIVLADADIEAAAHAAVRSRFQNTGQSCIAAKRFVVEEQVSEEFTERLVAGTVSLEVGDPLVESTEVGPLARDDLRQNLVRQIEGSLSKGARIECGGKSIDGPGFFFAPTVVTNATREMELFTEETFGPVAVLVSARDETHAVEIANDTRYGLAANIWTSDLERAEELAHLIEAGGVFINGMAHSDPRLPFGGVKNSGYGRELSEAGIKEFVNTKTLWRP